MPDFAVRRQLPLVATIHGTRRPRPNLRQSALLLQAGEDENATLNRGYVRYWIGLALAQLKQPEMAKTFLAAAIYKWMDFSPPRARRAESAFRELDLPESPFAWRAHSSGSYR